MFERRDKRGLDHLLAGKRFGTGLWRRRQGVCAIASPEGMIVRVTECDPICAMQACMDG